MVFGALLFLLGLISSLGNGLSCGQMPSLLESLKTLDVQPKRKVKEDCSERILVAKIFN